MPLERWSDNVIVVHLADDPQFSEDMQTIDETITTGSHDVVLDFASVHFVNSSNLARLLRLNKIVSGASRRLLVCSLSTQVWGAFLVTGLDKVFKFTDNVPTALATLQMA